MDCFLWLAVFIVSINILGSHSVVEYCAISSDDEGVEEEVVSWKLVVLKGLLITVSSSIAKLKTLSVRGLL